MYIKIGLLLLEMKTLLILPHESVKDLYEEAAKAHNLEVETNPYANSGFDLPLADDVIMSGLHKEDYRIKCAMYDSESPSAFYLYPRSSISKTSLRLANSVGIIDRGYRGNLCAMFDVRDSFVATKGQRLVQICEPSLEPFKVNIVSELNETLRGEGGFGSTGSV
jgi:dUTP pyrophosphatase